ncbi:hypothetical protein STXM2123_4845 [Streptomyces sp. F-3]|nr:hypothetical protein STXM2123_4845 [Streptomyces sp. F-3]
MCTFRRSPCGAFSTAGAGGAASAGRRQGHPLRTPRTTRFSSSDATGPVRTCSHVSSGTLSPVGPAGCQ